MVLLDEATWSMNTSILSRTRFVRFVMQESKTIAKHTKILRTAIRKGTCAEERMTFLFPFDVPYVIRILLDVCCWLQSLGGFLPVYTVVVVLLYHML